MHFRNFVPRWSVRNVFVSVLVVCVVIIMIDPWSIIATFRDVSSAKDVNNPSWHWPVYRRGWTLTLEVFFVSGTTRIFTDVGALYRDRDLVVSVTFTHNLHVITHPFTYLSTYLSSSLSSSFLPSSLFLSLPLNMFLYLPSSMSCLPLPVPPSLPLYDLRRDKEFSTPSITIPITENSTLYKTSSPFFPPQNINLNWS